MHKKSSNNHYRFSRDHQRTFIFVREGFLSYLDNFDNKFLNK
jgi:hypothetical protein